jgi:hypothetical protein
VDIAHIYPLNPTPEEEELLKNEERLSTDVNAIENLLALCEGCHTEFDKPRTVEDYRKVLQIKKTLLARSASREVRGEFKLQEELREIIGELMKFQISDGNGSDALSYDPKTLDEKVGDELSPFIKGRVRYQINNYYPFIREAFRTLEKASTSSAQQILLQVKTYYLEQTKLKLTHAQILYAIADWVTAQTGADPEVANILASFFVQNCEVF